MILKKSYVIACCLFFLSCSKSVNQNMFIGTWELRETIGGWTGIHTYPEGNGNIVTFSDDGRYSGTTITPDTSYSFSLAYKIVEADDCGKNVVFTGKDSSYNYQSQLSLSRDTLTKSDGSCIADGGTSIYVRK